MNLLDEDTTYFAIRSSDLRPGDIILSFNPDSKFSALISALTHSPFSHAFICTRPPECVESSDFGVARFVLDRFLIRDRAHIRVLRLKVHTARQDQSAKAADFAAGQVSRRYADKDVFTAPFPFLPTFQRGRFFCSQLVAEAYDRAGIALVPGRSSDKVSPGAIAQSPELEDITVACVCVATSADRLRFTGFLDQDSLPSPHTEEVERKQKIVDAVSPLLRKHKISADTYDDILGALALGFDGRKPWVPELDSEFASAFKLSGLIEILPKSIPADDPNFFIDLDVRYLLSSNLLSPEYQGVLRPHYEQILAVRDASIADMQQQADVSAKMFEISGLESVRLNLALLAAALAVLKRQRESVAGALEMLNEVSRRPSAG